MDIQNLRASFIEIKFDIDEMINLLQEDWFNEEKFIKAFAELKPYHLANDTLVGVLLDGLWLINTEDFYKHYSLEDIDFIYSKLTEYDNKVSLDLLLDYSNYLYSTVDQNSKAKFFSEKGMKRAKTYTSDFKKLIKEIDEEKKLNNI